MSMGNEPRLDDVLSRAPNLLLVVPDPFDGTDVNQLVSFARNEGLTLTRRKLPDESWVVYLRQDLALWDGRAPDDDQVQSFGDFVLITPREGHPEAARQIAEARRNDQTAVEDVLLDGRWVSFRAPSGSTQETLFPSGRDWER